MDAPYSRVLGYFIAEFMIRTALPVVQAFENDFEAALIFLVITTHNAQNVMLNKTSRQRYAALSEDLPLELLRPVSRRAVSLYTKIPVETVRRKVERLIEMGFVESHPRGLIVPSSVKDIPLYRDTVAIQEANLRRLFAMVAEAISGDPSAASLFFQALSTGGLTTDDQDAT
ncbi:MAG: hypothetical protein P3W87_007640 [Gammaproteobacteria bacterium]|nr:hypothetical protein [Gammaproteobacteria bacterium]